MKSLVGLFKICFLFNQCRRNADTDKTSSVQTTHNGLGLGCGYAARALLDNLQRGVSLSSLL